MYMEGVLTPFNSANIMCTPNGVEASINMFANRAIYDIKPKTAVQIFYKDWTKSRSVPGSWHLMFDGFTSSSYKVDAATEGRMVSIVCRDFRMDLRRSPAALNYCPDKDLTNQQLYSMHGLFQSSVVKGLAPEDNNKENAVKVPVRMYEDQLSPLDAMMRVIAGTAYGVGAEEPNKKHPGDYSYKGFGSSMQTDERGKAKCGFFLDALVRGIWTEAVGGTSLGVFLNKRIRADKRFYIPSNRSGYNMWNRQSAGLFTGSHVLGNSRFVNIETAIVACAAVFMVRMYSTSTPSLIAVGEKINNNPNPALKYTVDEAVRKFLIEDPRANFGAPYVLNESMLLPPMEFTAPPNCNIFLPPFCNNVTWQYDVDVDITRGYYTMVDSLSAYDCTDLQKNMLQVPNALFDVLGQAKSTDKWGRRKPPLTLEERYKGVNVSYGQVEYDLAANDAAIGQLAWKFKDKANAEYEKKMADLQSEGSKITVKKDQAVEAAAKKLPPAQKKKFEADHKKNMAAQEKRKISLTTSVEQSAVLKSMRRHALLKFLNEKYNGRVVTVDMMFNPYPMCGFPGMYVDDEEAGGKNSARTIIGMVQQIKHLIAIAPNGAQASTTVVMNNSRFIDEPVDMDADGNPLFMKSTDPVKAKIEISTLQYSNPGYFIPDPESKLQKVESGHDYDLEKKEISEEYKYAKDLLTLTSNDMQGGKSDVLYLDEEYDPQHIAAFYRDVFGHTENSFMIGMDEINNQPVVFIYDTMHEAVEKLRLNRKNLMYDYDDAMKFCSRNVCSADAFFHGILGLSVATGKFDDKGKMIYENKTENFDDAAIYDEYFGVTSVLFNSGNIDRLKAQNFSAAGPVRPGLMTEAGQFSSITETMPITAFIQERKDAVKNYIKDATDQGQGMRFTTSAGSR
jgi:hypothetical protein